MIGIKDELYIHGLNTNMEAALPTKGFVLALLNSPARRMIQLFLLSLIHTDLRFFYLIT